MTMGETFTNVGVVSIGEMGLGIAGGIPGSRAQFLGPRGDDGGALGRLERRDGGERVLHRG